MEKRDTAFVEAPLGSGTAAANFDLEEERTDGKEVVEMPQLISDLAAILGDRRRLVSLRRMERERERERESE